MFVSACEQDYQRPSSPQKIDPVAGTVIDPQFRDAFSNRFYIARVAKRKAADTHVNTCPDSSIAQFGEPLPIYVGLADLYHKLIVSHGIRRSKERIFTGHLDRTGAHFPGENR